MNLCIDKNKEFVMEQIGKFDPEIVGYLLIIANELKKAEKKHPDYPKDHVHQSAIIAEEAGETLKCSLEHKYEHGPYYAMHKEAIQTGAMALRFLVENWRSEKETSHRISPFSVYLNRL